MYLQLKQDLFAVEQREMSKCDWCHAASTSLTYIIAVPRYYVVSKERNLRAQRGATERKKGIDRQKKKKTSVALVYKKTVETLAVKKINIKKNLVKIIM